MTRAGSMFVRHYEPDVATRYFTGEEVRALFQKVDTLEARTAFIVGYETGCRIGELLSVTPQSIRFDDSPPQIWMLDSKKDRYRRQVMRGYAFNALKIWMDHRLGRKQRNGVDLFTKSGRTYNRWLKNTAERAGIHVIEGEERIRWHSWRGTYARRYQDKGLKFVSQQMGDLPSTVLKYYSDYTVEDLNRILNGEPLGQTYPESV